MQFRRFLFGFVLGLSAVGQVAGGTAEFRSHSHNDYEQWAPLAHALSQRMGSVEADVWLVKGELRVAHDEKAAVPDRTLRSLYLEPLQRHVSANRGVVYRDGPPLVLLIDLKSDGAPTYEAVERELAAYAGLFRPQGDGRPAAVQAIISGNAPIPLMLERVDRLASADGRPGDLEKNYPVAVVPLISQSWHQLFRWNGIGTMPAEEFARLQALVHRYHAQGRRLRLWASPETEAAWSAMLEAGVDFLNTDRPSELHAFLVRRR